MAAADPNTIKQVKTLKMPGDLLSVARVPGGDVLFVGNDWGKIYRVDWSGDKPETKELIGHTSYVSGLVLAGKHIVSGSWDRKLIWWDAETHQQVRTVENAHRKWIRHVAVAPDGKTVASVGDDMVGRLWDAVAGKLLHELQGHDEKTPQHFRSKLYTCVFSPDGQHLATGDHLGRILIWAVATGKQVAAVEAPSFYHWDFGRNNHSAGGVRCLAFTADGKRIAAGGIENRDVAIIQGTPLVQVFDWQKGQKTHEFKVGKDYVFESLRFQHEGAWLVGAGGGGAAAPKLVFFDLEQKKVVVEVALTIPLHAMTLNETSDVVYGAGRGYLVRWDLKR
ncbi:MAG: hypothetical protein K2R98_04060 [Gemmataceae bacterium]|nr:hypothetical protein [Gemmataceae bacterium]